MAGNGRVPKWTRCGKYLCLGKDINEEKKKELWLTMKYLLISLRRTFAHEPCHSEGVYIP